MAWLAQDTYILISRVLHDKVLVQIGSLYSLLARRARSMTDRSIYRSVARRFPYHRLPSSREPRRHSHERFIAEIELNFRSVSVSRSGILPIAIRGASH